MLTERLRHPTASSIADPVVSVLAALVAVALLVAVAMGDAVALGGDWIVVDRVGAMWVVFALTVGGAIRRFAGRQLAADPRRASFQVRSAAALGAGVLLFVAGNLVTLVIAAVVTSLAAAALIGVSSGAPVRAAVRRTRRMLLAADVVLIGAVVTVVTSTGDTSFGALAEFVASGGVAVHLVASAVVVAALVRCAQPPAHSWLAGSLVAPTPASALLHAGLVNAGGVLLIRTAPLVTASLVAVVIGLVTTGVAMTLGAAIMRSRSEVKTGLVWSTIAQMGLMLAQVLLGLGAAAAAHLVAHGAYKAHLFLSSGSVLEHAVVRAATIRHRQRIAGVGLGASVALVAVLVSGYDVTAHGGSAILLPALAGLTVSVVLVGPVGLRLGSFVRRALLVGVLAVAATVYLGVLARLETWLSLPDSTPAGAGAAAVALLVAVVLAAVATGAVRVPGVAVSAFVRARLEALARTPTLQISGRTAPRRVERVASAHDVGRPVAPREVALLVDLAANVVPPTWGLDHVVAVNPLQGLEDLPVEQARRRAADLFGARSHLPLPLSAERIWRDAVAPGHLRAAHREIEQARAASIAPPTHPTRIDPAAVDPTVIDAVDVPSADVRWIPSDDGPAPAAAELWRRGTAEVAAHVDALVADRCGAHLGAEMPWSDLYAAWRSLAAHDPAYRADASRAARAALPEQPIEVIAACLAARGVDHEHARRYLEAQAARLAGWVAAARLAEGADGVLAVVATRLAVEHVIVAGLESAPDSVPAPGTVPAPDSVPAPGTVSAPAQVAGPGHGAGGADDADRADVWQGAAELAYAERLLGRLDAHTPPSDRADAASGQASAQVVMCIDVRSEPVRRHLEAVGPYETFGFAGFFGMPVELVHAGSDHAVASCPVIVEPRARLVERAGGPDGARPAASSDVTHRAFHGAETGGPAAFALADASGWLLSLRTIATAIAPSWVHRLGARTRATLRGTRSTEWVLDAPGDGTGLSVPEQTALAHGALVAMGMTGSFAPIVVVCGHRSDNRNNPFRSSLDCGACGANPGGPNARVLAAICNRPEVRAELAELGIRIPDTTWFVAAEHETTDDTIELFDVEHVPDRLRPTLERLGRDLDTAGSRAHAERWRRLPGSPLATSASQRSHDPAQVVPDWGLVGCAAIVVGPRRRTAGLDLGGRTFLHSYDPDADPDGLVLEAIMTGPVVVAHWISSQYFASTVDPRRFGAGSKPFHNVVGRVGVIEGLDPELRIGLPLESVWFGGRPVHDPLRLLVVVDAPAGRVERVIGRNPVLRRIFDNGWARIAATGADGEFQLRNRIGAWEPAARWCVAEPADHERVDRREHVHVPGSTPAG